MIARCCTSRSIPATSHFEIFSSTDAKDDTPWTLHARGTFAERSPDEATTADLGAVRDRAGNEITQEDYYRTLASAASLGPAFQGIDGSGKEITRPSRSFTRPTATSRPRRYQIHPALLDSVFQLVDRRGALRSRGRARTGRVPADRRSRDHALRATDGRVLESRARREDRPVAHSVEGDVTVMAEDGNVFVEIRGLTCRLLEQSADQVKDWLYSYGWEASALGGDVAEPARIADGVGARVRDARRVVSDLRESTGWSLYYDASSRR